MAKKMGGFGIVVLLVVVAVILLLSARAWQSVTPTVSQLQQAGAIPSSGAAEAPAEGSGEGRRSLPNVGDMRDETSAHAERLQSALDQTE